MRVVLSPRAAALPQAAGVAGRLAGAGGSVVSLPDVGVRTLGRRLSAAEVHAVRKALLGLGPGQDLVPRSPDDALVGYVCVGHAAPGAPRVDVVVVTDHAGLSWRSPLRGPNDDSLGPRFPVTAGMYVPEAVVRALGTGGGGTADPAVAATGAGKSGIEAGEVAGVMDDARLNAFEQDVCARRPFAAVSSEIVPVALLAAHLGYRVAAAVVLEA